MRAKVAKFTHDVVTMERGINSANFTEFFNACNASINMVSGNTSGFIGGPNV